LWYLIFLFFRNDLISLTISSCPACSFQVISRISGSITVDAFNGQIETVGGVGETALHAFTLADGNL